MHLLRSEPGGFVDDADGIVRVEQSPADTIILSAADTELATLSGAANRRAQYGPRALRLCNLMHLRQHASVDLYVDEVLRHARTVVASVLGGASYWPYGVEQLVETAARYGQRLIVVSGDDTFDEALAQHSTVSIEEARRVWAYLRAGGAVNARHLLAWLDGDDAPAPQVLPKVVLYHPRFEQADLGQWQREWTPSAPVVAVLFYRAHLLAGNTAPFVALCEALQASGLNPLPVALASLKDAACMATLQQLLSDTGCSLILNTTAFAISQAGSTAAPIFGVRPVLQVLLGSTQRQAWWESSVGLTPRDLAMHIALPEVDGRIITRPVSFKGLARRCELTEVDVVHYEADGERCQWVAELARRWCALQRPNTDKRIAVILANYPTREGRLGNGVGLDTPASAIVLLQAMQDAGYPVEGIPEDGDALMQRLQLGVTNDPVARALRPAEYCVALSQYQQWYVQHLPLALREQVEARWGLPEAEPSLRQEGIPLALLALGDTLVGIQPARGYHLDHAATYHDPDLVPPHSYIAFYLWLREQADAVIHLGKHGNLEWLPGKGVALSPHCWPDALLGPMPHLYPFIVNDPGEGSQAKRRAQAVIIDHLIPPLTRAESYGPMAELERLVDEYYIAAQLDPRRATLLRQEILALAREEHFSEEVSGDDDALIGGIDNYLCELKERQIRDGLHIFGRAPVGSQSRDTLVALLRHARGAEPSILVALAEDLGLDCDPFDNSATAWDGPRPEILAQLDAGPWRHAGDTRERLELLAAHCIEHAAAVGPASQRALDSASQLRDLLDQCAHDEIHHTLEGLSGRFVPPGPSGAPSRGRLDVLPTGRNFYSVDVRALPTQSAWHLGWKSAMALVERHVQEQGDFPQQIGLSVWGTATMRTGGDDIAQAFALLGVRPVWDAASYRVVDFEVLPVGILDRPRIDVTLRVSGFFRDAFTNLIRLFDAAVQKVAALDEPEADNPIAARVRREAEALQAQGLAPDTARQRAGYRVFGSKPGSYGAGLQGLIDEGCWDTREDLAEAYLNWGGYAYGSDARGQALDGEAAHQDFKHRLAQIDTVVHNQDNREHDLLDSDDYYQFQGGMAAAVASYSGKEAQVYHLDHSNIDAPRVHTLKEEINRVVRARVLNPKWIAGVQRHGYKGAFEMAATVDYLFAFDATAQVVDDYQYEAVTRCYLEDEHNREFMREHNPAALKETAERLLEAIDRGLWEAPSEAQHAMLADMVAQMDEVWEQSM